MNINIIIRRWKIIKKRWTVRARVDQLRMSPKFPMAFGDKGRDRDILIELEDEPVLK